ncbi:MAG TPA: hypothetical protein VLL08_02130 [Kineosporiaceae bacterium]|nr:hypothetical protein [Kineosporiaceae bacterium]
MRLGLFVTATTLLGLSVTGCGGSAADNGPKDVGTPPGLSVSVLQYRSDYTIRRMQIKVTNASSAPVTVTAARLSSTAFSGGAAWLSRNQADETTIRPGTSTDLPAALPPSACATSPSGFRSAVRLDLRSADGSSARTAGLPVGDPYKSITRVHTEDCRREAALKIADLELVDPLRTTTRGGRLIGLLDLRLTPSGKPGTLTVESISSTTLLGPPTGAAWQIDRTVSAASGPQTVTLELRAARCDPHAIAEDKLGTVLPVTLHVDDGESGVVTVPADPDLRKQIQDFVHAVCADG